MLQMSHFINFKEENRKNDKKNIDVYYYLATSQNNLGKYKESIKNYEKDNSCH